MTIVLMVEGRTEAALKSHIKHFLDRRAGLDGKPRVSLETRPDVTLARGNFRKRVALELKRPGVTAVVALIDVYPDFRDAGEAKDALLEKAGRVDNFFAHAAQHEVEAWLLPYWNDICRRVGVQRTLPGVSPEEINHTKPPSRYLAELYRLAKPRPRKYVKTTEMNAILQGKDLVVAANQCVELKSFLNTLLRLNGLDLLP